MKRILYIFICTAVWLMCIPGANAQVNDKALTRSGEVSAYDGTRADFLTVAGKLSRYPKLSKAGESLKYAPIVSTDSVPEAFITAESARVYGNILFNGWLETVTAKGFEVSTNAEFPATATVQYPVVSETNQYVECDQPCTVNVFDLIIEQLDGNTTYYVRAYATNEMGTSYGQVLTFTTLQNVNIAQIPYFTDFKDGEEWILKNGDAVNYWKIAMPGSLTDSMLFITNDELYPDTCGYKIGDFGTSNYTCNVTASRLLQIPVADMLTVEFAGVVGGEATHDMLEVTLQTKDGSDTVMVFSYGNQNAVWADTLRVAVPIPNSAKGEVGKIVFRWKNDASVGRQPGAVISYLKVMPFSVTTDSVNEITMHSAKVFGTVAALNASDITEWGFCWSTNHNPTLSDNAYAVGSTLGSFSYTISDLPLYVTYYVRAYAKHEGVVYYGEELSFTTKASPLPLPYTTRFESWDEWDLSTVEKVNYWKFGTPIGYDHNVMFITNDTYPDSCYYYIGNASYDTATVFLEMPEGLSKLFVSVDYKVGGENGCDYVSAWLLDDYKNVTNPHREIILSSKCFSEEEIGFSISKANTEMAMLQFSWKNDASAGKQPGAVISSVKLYPMEFQMQGIDNITSSGVTAHVTYTTTNEYASHISEVGFCWGDNKRPTFEDNHHAIATNMGDLSYQITGLERNTDYFVRAYAIYDNDTLYTSAYSFTTLTVPHALPYVTHFEDAQDWVRQPQTGNYWTIGNLGDNNDKSLFVTNDTYFPNQCGYSKNATGTSSATRYLLMPSDLDSIYVSFDYEVGGTTQTCSYLSVVFQSQAGGSTSVLLNQIYKKKGHFSGNVLNPAKGGTAVLKFSWYNSSCSEEAQPAAAISNLVVLPVAFTTPVVTNITENSAHVEWAVQVTEEVTNVTLNENALTYHADGQALDVMASAPAMVVDLNNLGENSRRYHCRPYALYNDNTYQNIPVYGPEKIFSTLAIPHELPYQTNFGDGYAWDGDFYLDDINSYWTFGLLADYIDSAMYVTTGDGSEARYNESQSSNINVSRLLLLPETDSVHVTFSVKCGGEGSYDWMKVLLVPSNEKITAAHYDFGYSTNAMDFTNYLSQTGNSSGPYKLNLTQGTLQIALNMKNPRTADNDTAKLVFLWRTDGSGGDKQGPIITDLRVSAMELDVYTDSVRNITFNSAKVHGHFNNLNNVVVNKVGVCYGKTLSPSLDDNFVETSVFGADMTFELPISNLDYNTKYYVRTFAKVGNEIVYGSQLDFLTEMTIVPDEIPYVTDFTDHQQWWMNNGNSVNYWTIGKPDGQVDSMLYITNDAQYRNTFGYNMSSTTTVMAEKYLMMPDDENPLMLSFDVKVGGEDDDDDYLMVFLCPVNQEFIPNGGEYSPTNAFDFLNFKNQTTDPTSSRYHYDLTNGTVHISGVIKNPAPGDTAKLVFLWRNDGGSGTQPAAIISNLSVTKFVFDRTLPYSTDFSSENEEWILNGGTSKNYFMTGVPAGTTQSALFVTHDGETCSYLPDGTSVQSFTTAEVYFSLPESDSLLLEFDAKAGGEGCCDYLMAFVSKWDVEYTSNNVGSATSDNMGAVPFIGYSSEMSSSNTYRIQLTNGSDLHHFSVKVKNPSRNGFGKLAFAWRNDGSGGYAPFDVMVTNVSLTEVEAPQATKPTVNTIGVSYYQDGDVYFMECKVVSDGGSALTERGVCCSDNYTEPTLDNSFLVLHYSSAEEGTYNIGLSAEGLTPGATYYFRAYATNGVGTAYGEVMSFTVDAPVVDLMVDNLPYDNGFTDSDRWYFGTNYGNNYWTIDELTGNTTNSLYVTNDDSVATHYDISTPTDAYAVKLLYMPAVDSVYVSFDLEVGGEGYSQGNIYDFLTVALSAIENVSPTNGLIDEQYVSYILDSTYNTTIHVNMKVENPAPEDTAKLIFRWRNDYSAGTQPAAIISNLKVTVTNAVSCPASFTDTRDNTVYHVMQVGNNCWMAENLRYINGDLPVVYNQYSDNTPYLYAPNDDNSANNIANYGYLYNWTAAINSASSTSEGMQGLCPAGWHLPTEAEAIELVEKLDSVEDFSAQFLKASGYYLSSSQNPRGFGACDWYWITYNEGQHNACIPWCTDESSTNAISTNSNRANALSVRCVKNSESGPTVPEVNTLGSYYSSLYGDYVMRCQVVSDGGSDLIERGVCFSKTLTEPTLDNGGSSIYETTTEVGLYNMALSNVTLGATYYFRAYATNSVGTAYGETKTFYVCGGTLTDTRNNQTYQTMMVDDVCWMKENLRYNRTSPAFPYGEDGNGMHYSLTDPYIYYPNGQSAHWSTYGYLYNWAAATNNATVTSEGMQGVCPDGWHLPTYNQAKAVRDKLSDATFKASFLDKHAGYVLPNSGYRYFGEYDWFWATSSGNDTNTSLDISGTTWTVVGNTGKNFGRSIRCVKE